LFSLSSGEGQGYHELGSWFGLAAAGELSANNGLRASNRRKHPAFQRRMPLRKVKLDPGADKDSSQSKQRDLDRPTAVEIYEQVSRNARHELLRPAKALAVSGIVGGLTMGLTGLSVSVVSSMLGNTPLAQFVALLFYPMGFLAVILGRGQLFTENTLYPIALILAERRHFLSTTRLWAIVFPSNVAGAFLFALLAARTSALRPDQLHMLVQLGTQAASPSMHHIFWSGVVGGWIIAMVAWLVSGSHSITGSVAVIWVLTFIVGAGHFAHCIATSGEILAAVLTHAVTAGGYFRWLVVATSGNIVGGVVLVTLLEYGQVKLD
jgi:formate/nitrite transporter FocA (FNT family)